MRCMILYDTQVVIGGRDELQVSAADSANKVEHIVAIVGRAAQNHSYIQKTVQATVIW